MRIVIDGRPVGKSSVRHTRYSKGTYYTPSTRIYMKKIGEAYLRCKDKEHFPEGVPVSVMIVAEYPIVRGTSKVKAERMLSGKDLPTKKPDADNIAKICLDALTKLGVWDDDRQITFLWIRKRYSSEPKVTIVVERDEI